MKIFNNNKVNSVSDDNIGLSDYNLKLEERRTEYEHLNEILRGMRAEVSNLMEEIKNVTDNLVKKNAELFLLEQSIDDLKRSSELLQQNVKYEEEAFNKANNELIKIKKEIIESLPYQDKLSSVKKEYEAISIQLISLQKVIELIKSETNPTQAVSIKNNTESILEPLIVKKKKKCQAKTKTGSKCKRYASEGSFYCSFHSSNFNIKK
jgi:chromosome segregation ATPase